MVLRRQSAQPMEKVIVPTLRRVVPSAVRVLQQRLPNRGPVAVDVWRQRCEQVCCFKDCFRQHVSCKVKGPAEMERPAAWLFRDDAEIPGLGQGVKFGICGARKTRTKCQELFLGGWGRDAPASKVSAV